MVTRYWSALKQRTSLLRLGILKLKNRHLKRAFAIKSHLTTEERIALSRLAEGRQVICEIGSYIGASACCFGAAMARRGSGRILCIDTWNNDAMSEGNWDTYAEFTRNTSPYARFVVPVRGFSTDVVETVAGDSRQLDLLFIDGDHSYDGVKADWECYRRLLKPGSLIVLHDWGWASGVQRVIAEDIGPQVTNVGSLPNMWWGTVRGG